jgi:hypothetical protein
VDINTVKSIDYRNSAIDLTIKLSVNLTDFEASITWLCEDPARPMEKVAKSVNLTGYATQDVKNPREFFSYFSLFLSFLFPSSFLALRLLY